MDAVHFMLISKQFVLVWFFAIFSIIAGFVLTHRDLERYGQLPLDVPGTNQEEKP